ncbi:hypothetical protein T01_8428, partial [Trichinella spiralis]
MFPPSVNGQQAVARSSIVRYDRCSQNRKGVWTMQHPPLPALKEAGPHGTKGFPCAVYQTCIAVTILSCMFPPSVNGQQA